VDTLFWEQIKKIQEYENCRLNVMKVIVEPRDDQIAQSSLAPGWHAVFWLFQFAVANCLGAFGASVGGAKLDNTACGLQN